MTDPYYPPLPVEDEVARLKAENAELRADVAWHIRQRDDAFARLREVGQRFDGLRDAALEEAAQKAEDIISNGFVRAKVTTEIRALKSRKEGA